MTQNTRSDPRLITQCRAHTDRRIGRVCWPPPPAADMIARPGTAHLHAAKIRWPAAERYRSEISERTDELVPILRVENADTAAQWYSRLGFVLEGVHRFGPGFPAYTFLRRGATNIHLSEHHGDAPPRGVVYWYVDRLTLETFASEFSVAIERQPWCDEIQLADPDGNRLRVGCPNDEDDPGFTATTKPG